MSTSVAWGQLLGYRGVLQKVHYGFRNNKIPFTKTRSASLSEQDLCREEILTRIVTLTLIPILIRNTVIRTTIFVWVFCSGVQFLHLHVILLDKTAEKQKHTAESIMTLLYYYYYYYYYYHHHHCTTTTRLTITTNIHEQIKVTLSQEMLQGRTESNVAYYIQSIIMSHVRPSSEYAWNSGVCIRRLNAMYVR